MLNFSIVISTQQSSHNEWMAFACWYSIHYNLPNNKVAVAFPRSFKHHQFTWLNKCHVPYIAYPSDATLEQAVDTLILNYIISTPLIIIKDNQMVIREIKDSIEGITLAENLKSFALCSSENSASIVDYTECSKFSIEDWKKTEQKHPFYKTSQLVDIKRTVNEQRVFKLWKQMGTTFDFLNR